MGVALSDAASAPSVWGATNASCASIVFPLGRPVALVLAGLVSDPAQIWHAGDWYRKIAK